MFREVQGNRPEALAARKQVQHSKDHARTAARGQWAKWRASAIETKLNARLVPIADALRNDMRKLHERRAELRQASERVVGDRIALESSMAQPLQSIAHTKAEVR